MNAYAIFAVNEHLEYLIDEAARNRSANAGKPSLFKRIASAFGSFRPTAGSSILPKLEDASYRG